MSIESGYDFSGSIGAEKAEKTGGAAFARRLEYFSLKADAASEAQGANTIFVRFLTNDRIFDSNKPVDAFSIPWITALQHYSATRPKPSFVDEKTNWPQKMYVGCRKDKIFASSYGGKCIPCANGDRASNRTWALAVEREEVRNETNQVVSFRDKTREVPVEDANGNWVKNEDGSVKTETIPAYLVMNMGWKNFFGTLSGLAQYYNTLLDADYRITRKGTEPSDTTYTSIRLDPVILAADNPYGLPAGKFDLTDPELKKIAYPNMPDLRAAVSDKVSNDFVGRFFDPTWLPEVKEGSEATSSGPAAPAPAGSSEPTPEALELLRQRMMQGVGG